MDADEITDVGDVRTAAGHAGRVPIDPLRGFAWPAVADALMPQQLLRTEPKPFRSPEPIELKTIAEVAVEQSPLEWIMFAGKLRLKFERDTQAEVVLGPVSMPKRRAKLIQEAIDGGAKAASSRHGRRLVE